MSLTSGSVGEIIGWVGTAISTYFYISPVVPFMNLLKEKIKYGDAPGVLLICSFMNCILWVDYGLMKKDLQIYFANSLGGGITLIWIVIFLISFAGKNLLKSILYNASLMLIISGINLLCYFVIDYTIVGYIAMGFNILMYAAPGEKIIKVIKTGNYNLIPIFSSVGGALCSSLWLSYGIYRGDWNVIIPNLLGVIFAILQIAIFIIVYCKQKNKKGKNADKDEDTNVEVKEDEDNSKNYFEKNDKYEKV